MIEIPEKPTDPFLAAIFHAWDHYGPVNQPRLMGAAEAKRIYGEIVRAAKESRT